MRDRVLLCAAVAPLGFGAVISTAAGSAVKECGSGPGGAYTNITARSVSCSFARAAARRIFNQVSPCFHSENNLGTCRYSVGLWSVSGRWFHDRYGGDQLDLRATASASVV